MPRHRKDYSDAIALYEQGQSIGSIADVYNITRQAMWKILKRRNVKFREQLKYGQDNHFYVDGLGYEPYQVRARNITMNAISQKILIPEPCERCGFQGTATDGRSLVHAHHSDYSKPLQVNWICQRCHYKEHHNANADIRPTKR